jgi:hypothetical protein
MNIRDTVVAFLIFSAIFFGLGKLIDVVAPPLNAATNTPRMGANLREPTVIMGQTTVTTAGTEVVVTTNDCETLSIKALLANTNNIYVGVNPVTSSTGYELDAGHSIDLNGLFDGSYIYIDSDTNGEGVSWICFN